MREGTISAILPLFSVSNWILGNCLLSVPFAVYGGVVADDEDSERDLIEQLTHVARAQRVDYTELRTRQSALFSGFLPDTKYATFGTELSSNPDVSFKRLPRDTRYMIRKGQKAGLSAKFGLDQMPTFYSLFARNMHSHGTPLFPRALFDNLMREFEARMNLLIVYAGTKAVAGVLSFCFRDNILPYYAGTTPESRTLAANNYMYWELMTWAAEHGFKWFDFGRSKKNTGAYAFKSQWNMNVEDLNYQVLLGRRTTMPNVSPVNPRFSVATKCWRSLPFWATTIVGPRVSRWFP